MGFAAEFFLALGCITINAIFVAAEFALIKVRASRLQELHHKGNRRAGLVLRMLEDVDGYLSASQFGITLMSIGLGSIGEPAVAATLREHLPEFGGYGSVVAHSVATALAFILITYFQIVLGELVPRALSIRRAESYILALSPGLYFFRKALIPLLWIFDKSAKFILTLLGVRDYNTRQGERFSEDEIRLVLAQSVQGGALADAKHDLIDNVFDFSKRTARHVMIARDDIVSLDLEQSIKENLQTAKSNNHTRYPLCEGSIDQVVGLVNFKDVLWQSQESRDNLDFKKIRREILFVPENKPLTKLLKDFQRNKIHMAIVIDEFGITSGLATLEDVLEELVGEIQDEYDQEKSNIQLLRDGSYLINGSTLIEEVEEKLGLKIDKEENTTIAGAVLSKLGELPKVGDRVEFGAFEFVVQSLKGRRIYLLKVVKKAIKA